MEPLREAATRLFLKFSGGHVCAATRLSLCNHCLRAAAFAEELSTEIKHSIQLIHDEEGKE